MAKTIEELRDAVKGLADHTTPKGKVNALDEVLNAIVDKLEELEGGGE